nr:hypothetical protein [Nocardioides flavescens]
MRPSSGPRATASSSDQARAEEWFLDHGLTYFVPELRQAVREELRVRRTAPVLAAVLVLALGAGVAIAWATGQVSVAPATLVSLALLGGAAYAVRRLHVWPILRWALARTFGSLFRLLPMTTRALPLLLLAITFLFVNTEVWQVASGLPIGRLWLVVVIFLVLGVAFLLVRLPEEVDKADDDVDDDLLLEVCAGTPVAGACRELVAEAGGDPARDPVRFAEVTGYERWNLVLVLVVIQGVQVLLLTVSVFAFLLLFGSLTMTSHVMDSWIEAEVSGLTPQLVKVSLFLAAFSGLYLTVSTVTDETYRDQFFGDVMAELRRAVGVRAVYLALRQAEPAGAVTAGGEPAPPAPAG